MGWCWQTRSQWPCSSTQGGDWHQQLQWEKNNSPEEYMIHPVQELKILEVQFLKVFSAQNGQIAITVDE